MTEEKTGENQGEKPTSPEKRERAAVCLVCSDEWIARNGGAKKPSKCPTCGTKRCAWKDDLPAEPEKQPEEQEKTALFAGEKGETEGEEKEKTGEIEEKTEEKREEKRENNIAGYIKNPATGKSYPVKKHSSKIADLEGGGNEGKNPEEKTAPGNFPIILVVGGLVLLGCLAGVGWFLGRRPDPRNRSVPAVYRPSKAETAMMKLGGV